MKIEHETFEFHGVFIYLGCGVPMPLPVRSRRYDEAFWKELLKGGKKMSEAENLKELGF